MAELPFDREIWNSLERPLSTDNNQSNTNSDNTLRCLIQSIYSSSAGTLVGQDGSVAPGGFIGDGWKVRPAGSPNLTVSVTAGIGFFDDPSAAEFAIDGIVGVDDPQRSKPLVLPVPVSLAVPPNTSGSDRYDLIEVSWNPYTTDIESRNILNPTTGTFSSANKPKTLSWATLTGVGIATGSGAPPAGTTLYYKNGGYTSAAAALAAVDAGFGAIAIVYVPSGATAITGNNLIDLRHMIFPGGVAQASIAVGPWDITGVSPRVPPMPVTAVGAPPGMIVAAYPVFQYGVGSEGGFQGLIDLVVSCGLAPRAVFASVSTWSVSPYSTPDLPTSWVFDANVQAAYVRSGILSTISSYQLQLLNGDNDANNGDGAGPSVASGSTVELAVGQPIWLGAIVVPKLPGPVISAQVNLTVLT